jgi:hypothetical protein
MGFFNRPKKMTTDPFIIHDTPAALPVHPDPELLATMDERRPCWVRGRRALFHRWINSAHPVLPRGVEPSDKARFFQFRSVTALVEFEDGTVGRCYPNEVQFADGGGFDKFAWRETDGTEAEPNGTD